MWIATVVVPLGLLAVPLWLAHLEERVISRLRSDDAPDDGGSGAPVAPDPGGAAQPRPFALVEHPGHRAA